MSTPGANTEEAEMNTVTAHITVQGKPLCQFAGGHLMDRHHCTCGHTSLASAKRAKTEIQKHVHTVRVVRGHCPVSGQKGGMVMRYHIHGATGPGVMPERADDAISITVTAYNEEDAQELARRACPSLEIQEIEEIGE